MCHAAEGAQQMSISHSAFRAQHGYTFFIPDKFRLATSRVDRWQAVVHLLPQFNQEMLVDGILVKISNLMEFALIQEGTFDGLEFNLLLHKQ